jgi:hypothetical protein
MTSFNPAPISTKGFVMKRFYTSIALFAMLAISATPVTAASPSEAEQQIAQAAAEQKYAFIMFYKQKDATTDAVAATLAQGIADRKDQAVVIYVNVANPAEKALVEKHKTARAPMPLTLAVAPNGAITGVFAQKLEVKHIGESFVTPTTAECMKSLQEGKPVLLCVHPTEQGTTPAGVREFQSDPQFKGRVSLVSMRLDDKSEASFLTDLEIDAAKTRGTTVVFMAPPGAMVGKYTAQVTKAKLAADLHAAGKCCDDPNCKHGKKAN